MTARPLQISNGFDLSEHNATLQKTFYLSPGQIDANSGHILIGKLL